MAQFLFLLGSLALEGSAEGVHPWLSLVAGITEDSTPWRPRLFVHFLSFTKTLHQPLLFHIRKDTASVVLMNPRAHREIEQSEEPNWLGNSITNCVVSTGAGGWGRLGGCQGQGLRAQRPGWEEPR